MQQEVLVWLFNLQKGLSQSGAHLFFKKRKLLSCVGDQCLLASANNIWICNRLILTTDPYMTIHSSELHWSWNGNNWRMVLLWTTGQCKKKEFCLLVSRSVFCKQWKTHLTTRWSRQQAAERSKKQAYKWKTWLVSWQALIQPPWPLLTVLRNPSLGKHTNPYREPAWCNG